MVRERLARMCQAVLQITGQESAFANSSYVESLERVAEIIYESADRLQKLM